MDNYKACPFRKESADGKKICGLAQSIVGTSNEHLFVINDTICEACYETKEIPDTQKINTVVAYLLTDAAKKIMDLGGLNDCTVDRACSLLRYIKKENKPCPCNDNKKLVRIIGNVR